MQNYFDVKVISFTQRAFTDFYAFDNESKKLLVMSAISNRENCIRAVTSTINLGERGFVYKTDDIEYPALYQMMEQTFECEEQRYSVKIEKIEKNKSNFYHALATHKDLLDERGFYFVCQGDVKMTLFNKLMKKFNLPLLPEWADCLYNLLVKNKYLSKVQTWSSSISQFNKIQIYKLDIEEEQFEKLVSDALRNGFIKICEKKQKPLQFRNLDEYFTLYGDSIVEDVCQNIKPLSEKEYKNTVLLKKKRLFPKQAMVSNGIAKLLESSTYGLVTAQMGTGKTLMGSTIVEKYEQNKLKNIIKETSVVELSKKANYRTIIICPSHLLQKWAREIRDEIPLAKVTILHDFKDVVEMVKEAKKKPLGKNFYVISKDFSKLDFQLKPAVTRWGKKSIKYVECSECGDTSTTLDEFIRHGSVCRNCHKDSLQIADAGYAKVGWICPECGEILYPNDGKKLDYNMNDGDMTLPLEKFAFDKQRTSNSTCRNCGCSLWTPNIQNIDTSPASFLRGEKQREWVRVSYWRNQNKKTTKTIWVHKRFLDDFTNSLEEGSWSISRELKNRKISPVRYIKKNLHDNTYDFLIADEAHEFKAGGSAQANAFHVLIKKSKKQIILTGTLLGGVAQDLFYLIYRLDPCKMKNKGYKFTDSLKFSEEYGVVEQKILYDSEQEMNSSSKGKVMAEPRVKPGISPLLYAHFLLGKCIFLSLSDLSTFLPKYIEKPIRVNMNEEMAAVYNETSKFFKSALREKGGSKLLSSMLQTLLSFPDKLFGLDSIRHPIFGNVIYKVPELDTNVIYPKEKALIERINQEMSEGRPCFVFSVFSGEGGDKDTLPRIKEIIEKHCNLEGKVDILRSTTVKAEDREEWLDNAYRRGIKVVICNPKLVSTGLDLIEYPTLIFYSTGYSLITIWQSAYRAYRLIQKKECRVYYLAYIRTLQDDCLQIMASKKVATAAVQGSFSSDGLAAMAQGVDPQVLLAQSLMEGSSIKDSRIDEMFEQINQVNTLATELSEEDLEFLEEVKKLEHQITSEFSDLQSCENEFEPAKDLTVNLGATYNILSGFFNMLDSFKTENTNVNNTTPRPAVVITSVARKKSKKKNLFSEEQITFGV